VLLPASLDFEILIVDKLARYILRDVEQYETKLETLTESVWADELYERLVAAGDEEITANNQYWSNRQQAALAEDQQAFIKSINHKRRMK
jgi:uncharacterized glyoxalase superfamily protein PhnB